MIHIITELSRYTLVALMIIYVYESFAALMYRDPEAHPHVFRVQVLCIFLLHLNVNLLFFCAAAAGTVEDGLSLKGYVFFYVLQIVFIIVLYMIFAQIYEHSSMLLVNHMCMLMVIGFMILTRLDPTSAMKQFAIAFGSVVLSAFVPLFVRKFRKMRDLTWVYCVVGIAALAAVRLFSAATYGAEISFTIAGVTFQPSEIVKILFVLFVACMFYKSTDFKQVCIATVIAAAHVVILVASSDLGAALIFFITYLFMLFVAARKVLYLAGGAALGALAGYAAAHLFSHVQTRVEAWKDPLANISGSGYQVAQSLFAIGTGGWFGMGIFQGVPDTIPVATSDFVFSAIIEEFGGVFGICLILICFTCLLLCLNLAMKMRDPFYRLVALGLGCTYGVQVILNIGGVIKFIPSTGVTLPFVSYGGTSIFCSIIMFAIIQGLYMMRREAGDLEDNVKGQPKTKKGSGEDRQSGTARSGQDDEDERIYVPDEFFDD